ncbi:hypothetical protein AVKW3434_10240 [Acidovorax sp. SUPP3434]|uniref:hypothetical protein n=1 Tax=Acidovorax sp. SUPP3434 TaxID=2920880 RepID=UPI0023DE38A4|nr:hypothetical protein [Acidovorax sp. SUPP3434]GKS99758.1 hypothetical protein AVKW3434_10240 [Acidovorax sp. SUPP3434]
MTPTTMNASATPSRRWLAAAPLIVVSALALTACDRNKPADTPTNTAPVTTPAPTPPATPAPAMPATPASDAGMSSTPSSSASAGGAVFGGSTPAPATAASEPASDAK